jgi:hypothetical protein
MISMKNPVTKMRANIRVNALIHLLHCLGEQKEVNTALARCIYNEFGIFVTGLKGQCPLSTCLFGFILYISALVSYLANSVCSFSKFFIVGTAKFLGLVQKQIVHFFCVLITSLLSNQ